MLLHPMDPRNSMSFKDDPILDISLDVVNIKLHLLSHLTIYYSKNFF